MKRKMLLVLCLTLLFAFVLNGCTPPVIQEGKTTEPTAGQSASATTEKAKEDFVLQPASYPLVKDKITLKIFTSYDGTIEDMETNLLTVEYEEKTNVHVEWDLVNGKDMEQKRNLLLATNSEMPDIFMNAAIGSTMQLQYGEQGVLIDLSDLIDKYGYYIHQLFDYNPRYRKLITAPNGKIYSLPSVEETYHTTLGQKMWINKDWLAKLNLNMPTTTDELYNVLKAFKENDPNGNKLADEIPLTGAIKGYNLYVYHFIMCAFIQNQGFDQKPFILENGKVSVAFDQDGWKEGLKYLNKLYNDGLLDQGAITQDNVQLKQLAENPDTVLLGCVTAGAMTGFLNAGSERMNYYTSVPPLKGPKGVQTTGYYPNQANVGKFAVTSSCKYPDVAVKWVDWFYSIDGTLRSNAGRQDIEWRFAKDGEIGLNGEKGTYVRLLKFGKTQNVHWNKTVPNFYSVAFRNGQVAEPTDQESILFNETREKYEPYKPAEVLPPLFMEVDESEEYLGIEYSLMEYLKESTARFVVGDMDIDGEWQNYLNELKKIGLERYIELTQSAYDRQYSK